MNKETAILIALALGTLLFMSGCVFVTKAQLEGKLPRIDAAEVTVTASTIYGVSGSLTEKNVKWQGDRKTVEQSELRITSPLGSYHRAIKGASAVNAPPSPESP